MTDFGEADIEITEAGDDRDGILVLIQNAAGAWIPIGTATDVEIHKAKEIQDTLVSSLPNGLEAVIPLVGSQSVKLEGALTDDGVAWAKWLAEHPHGDVNDPEFTPGYLPREALVAELTARLHPASFGLDISYDPTQFSTRYWLVFPQYKFDGTIAGWRWAWMWIADEIASKECDNPEFIPMLCDKLHYGARNGRQLMSRSEIPHTMRYFQDGQAWDGRD